MRYCLKNWIFAGEEKHPYKLWRRLEGEKIKLGSTIINQVSQDFLPLLFPFSVKVNCLQLSSKLVTPYPRLQGCNILNNSIGLNFKSKT